MKENDACILLLVSSLWLHETVKGSEERFHGSGEALRAKDFSLRERWKKKGCNSSADSNGERGSEKRWKSKNRLTLLTAP